MRSTSILFKLFSTLFLAIFSISAVFGQWTIGGSTATQPNDCYRLTTNANALSGYAYNPQSINLNDSFDLSFTLYLGNLDAGADGIMFILRSSLDPSQLIAGGSGGTIGYTGTGLENGSLGIEIDTYQNNDLGDPSYDHLAIFKNASTNHNLSNLIAPAVMASSTSGNIENGANHILRVKWNPGNLTLLVFFDCALRITYSGNIISEIFSGNANVYYGFIGTTGGVNNTQSFCLTQPIDSLLTTLIDDTVCQGESVQLNAGSSLVSYSWAPATSLNSANTNNPVASPQVSTTYTVTATYNCETRLDTVDIGIFETDKSTFSLGNDTIICSPDSLVIDLSSTNYQSYLWNDGSSEKINVIKNSSTRVVTITDNNNCIFSDTIYVDVHTAPNFTLGADKVICPGDSINLMAPFPTNFHFWSTGVNSPSISVKIDGVYWLSISTDSICFSADTVLVSSFPEPDLNLGNDTTICSNMTLLLSAASSNAETFLWSNGTNSPTTTVQESGLYWVQILISTCYFSDSINIYPRLVEEVNLGNDTSICRGDVIILTAPAAHESEIVWNNGSSDSILIVHVPGLYTLSVTTLDGCETYGEINVDEIVCPGLLDMPNVFSPNNDHINDFFEPRINAGIEKGEIIIFNRWGQKIYSGSLSEKPWDGTINGRECANGIYYWTAFFNDFYGTEYSTKGSFTLVR